MASEPVVLVHGLWMNGLVFGVLRQRLQQDHGFETHTFAYPTLRGDLAEVARDLGRFVARVAGDRPVHLVGHSLGGALVYRALGDGVLSAAGKAVLIGSPLSGSRAARDASRWTMLQPVLGPHVLREFAAPCERCWTGPNAVGAIAGTRRMGIGQYFARFDEDNDGTVGVSETVIPGLADHLVLPHSHMGLLFADDVAAQVAHFLREGRFHR